MTDKIKVRFKGEIPPRWHYVTQAEYHRLTEEGQIVKPYDPDRESPKWPDMSGMYVQAPDVGRPRRGAPAPHEIQEQES